MANKKKGGANKNNNNNGGSGGAEGGGGEKKEVGMNVVVMKIDLHCEGCAAKVIKAVRSFDGVESAKVGDGDLTKLTVVGKVEPAKIQEKVELKTKKKAEIVSPSAKKDKNDVAVKDNNGGGDAEEKEKQEQPQPQPQQQQNNDKKNNSKNKKDESKSKELPMTTAVLKVNLHCQGCIEKIHKVVSKTKGYMEMSIDKQKDLVTVKGAIDVKALVEKLKRKLKKPVEIVPPKKEGGGGGDNNNNNKSGGGGGEKVKGGGEEKAGKGNGGGGKGVEGQKMEYSGESQTWRSSEYIDYGSGYGANSGAGYTLNQVIVPELFSDENPNACVVM